MYNFIRGVHLPRIDGQFVIWLENFAGKIQTYAAALGIAPADAAQLQTDLTTIRSKLADVQTAKTSLASAVQAKEQAMADISKRIRDTVAVLKRKSAYTNTIGADLGIIGPSDGGEPAPLPVPEFQVTAMPDRVRLDWIKNYSDGIVIQCKRGNEIEFTTIGRDAISPYDDDRPCLTPGTPEVRIYRIRYLRGDNEVGEWSKEARILFVK